MGVAYTTLFKTQDMTLVVPDKVKHILRDSIQRCVLNDFED